LPDLWSKVKGLGRFARRLRRLVDEPIALDQATTHIRDGVARRDERFLAMFARVITPYPRSPYRQLLASAGCGAEDVAALVDRDGLDAALQSLARAGVYVSYDEFKCRRPAVRGSQTFHFSPEDFDDPLLTGYYAARSSGTRGVPTRVPIDADLIADMATYWAVFLAEHDALTTPLLFWTPGHAGVAARYLACAKAGQTYSDWFVSEGMHDLKDRVYASSIHRLARRAGRFPNPRAAAFDNPGPVLDRVLELLDDGQTPALNTAPSAAVKLSLEAQRRGRSLAGVRFLLGSEPLTPARRRSIEASGATAAPLYGSTEAPWIGGQCRQATASDEVHVLLDSYAVVPVESTLLFTSLRGVLPKVLLNVDIGDRAVIEQAPCDCAYGRLGCEVRLHTIRSSDKITEFGVTFAVQDVFHVLEDALPRRFGGEAGDYQLVEDRDANGLPRYTIVVDPRLSGIDAGDVPDTFLREMAKLERHYGFMAAVWAREKIITVRREAPLAGSSGKRLPFYRKG
jgi:phenylacetate-coenzyme A ligase PaaK-like adenylate-forming protein